MISLALTYVDMSVRLPGYWGREHGGVTARPNLNSLHDPCSRSVVRNARDMRGGRHRRQGSPWAVCQFLRDQHHVDTGGVALVFKESFAWLTEGETVVLAKQAQLFTFMQ